MWKYGNNSNNANLNASQWQCGTTRAHNEATATIYSTFWWEDSATRFTYRTITHIMLIVFFVGPKYYILCIYTTYIFVQ